MKTDKLKPDEINTVTLKNFEKFFSDHPELDKTEVDKRIAEECRDSRRCCITGRGGMISGRNNIERLLGGHSGIFFQEVAKSEEHINIAVKGIQEFDASLK